MYHDVGINQEELEMEAKLYYPVDSLSETKIPA